MMRLVAAVFVVCAVWWIVHGEGDQIERVNMFFGLAILAEIAHRLGGL